jgi:hypothetical protein
MHYNKPRNGFLPCRRTRREAAGAAAGKEAVGRLLGRSWCKITGSTETSSEVA